MKTLIKLTVVLAGAFIGSAGTLVHAGSGKETIERVGNDDEEYTEEEKEAAIKAVTDAVATGDEAVIQAAINQQVSQFPAISADLVSAAIAALGGNNANAYMVGKVVSTAVNAAPSYAAQIVAAALAAAPHAAGQIKVSAGSGIGINPLDTTRGPGGKSLYTPPTPVS